MPYFADHYGSISYPLPGGGAPGLYNAQLGAAHSLAAHYTVDDRAAIVTMPTGSGKTAVIDDVAVSFEKCQDSRYHSESPGTGTDRRGFFVLENPP